LSGGAVKAERVAVVEIISVIVAAAMLIGPFAVLSILAIAYGVDSRPSIGDDRSIRSPRWI
jgi:hypothetical protein